MLTPNETPIPTPARAALGIPSEVLDHFMAAAYRLYQSAHYADAEVICRGLLAADPHYWYPYSLHAATLLKLGRLREALAQVEIGLRHEPGQPKLISLRSQIVRAVARWRRVAARGKGRRRLPATGKAA